MRLIFTPRNLVVGLVCGLLAGVGVEIGSRFRAELGAPLVVGLGVGLGVGLVNGLDKAFADPDSTSSSSPAVAWRDDRSYAIGVGILSGVVLGLVAGLVGGLVAGPGAGISAGVVAVLGVGLGLGLLASRGWSSTLAMAQLAKEWHTPPHLISFLEDAHERNVLRTVGSAYQFRHARLQDRLAAADGQQRP